MGDEQEGKNTHQNASSINSSFSKKTMCLIKPEASIIEEPDECDESNKSDSMNPIDLKAPPLEEITLGKNTNIKQLVLEDHKLKTPDGNINTLDSKYCTIVDQKGENPSSPVANQTNPTQSAFQAQAIKHDKKDQKRQVDKTGGLFPFEEIKNI